MGNRLSNN